jgi:hypothetical protein
VLSFTTEAPDALALELGLPEERRSTERLRYMAPLAIML